jgi:START domain
MMSSVVSRFFFVAIVLFFFPSSGFSQINDWKFVKKTDGISVYHRKIGNGNLKDVKIETMFDSNLSTITEALLDVPAFNKWIYKVEFSRVLRVVSSNQVEYYNRINMPWPSTDRDIVAINKITQNSVTKEVISEDICNSKGLAEKKDLVRIKDFYAKWTFTPTANGIKGTYIFHSDPGGDLPAAVVNLFIDEGPVNSIKGLKNMLKLDKYKNSNSHNIIN